MQSLATPEQIQFGVPMTFSLEIRAPQNGQQSIEQTPVLAKFTATYGAVPPNEIPQASQHASEQLAQLCQQEIQNQFGVQQQQQQRKFGGGSGGSQWGQREAAAGGSR